MSEQGHTPGPWQVQDWANNTPIVGPDNRPVAYSVFAPTRAIGEADANARLIAAAPELLAALENLLTYDRVERPAFRAKPVGAPGSQARIKQNKLIALEDAARAAIKKATGQ